jgi:hypothetical protein
MNLRIASCALALLLVCSCSSSGTNSTPDSMTNEDAGVAVDVPLVLPDLSADVAAEVHLDIPPMDNTPPPPTCDEYPRPFGCPCGTNDDCMAGYCAFHMGEKVCSVQCIDECPDDWKCELAPGFGADEIYVCISNFSHLCLPCSGAPDCPKAPDHCADYGNGAGFFCGAGCEANEDCPEGFACTAATSFEGTPVKQCMTVAGLCQCSSHAASNSLGTSCGSMNEIGTCLGWRFCGQDGLTDCDAPVPIEEVCFNETDDDCNGIVDDGVNCCISDCTGKVCGDDGCSESCGECGQQEVCSDEGTCVCVPDCEGKECGSDGCEGDCGGCPPGTICVDFQCAEGCETDDDCQELQECVEDFCLADLPDQVKLLEPTALETIPSATSPAILATVFEADFSEPDGPSGILAQYGFGPAETDPTLSTKWTWADAGYDDEDAGTETYTATVANETPGSYSFTFRFSLDGEHWVYADTTGSADGWNPEDIGLWTVAAPPLIDSLTPSHGTVLGDTQVAMNGDHFDPAAVMAMDGIQLTGIIGSQTGASFNTPAHDAGPVPVTIINPNTLSFTLDEAFTFVLEFTATMDGIATEWLPVFQVGENQVESNWDPALNKLVSMSASYDDEFLYIAVEGFWEPQNYLVGYVDVDFGQETGVSDILGLGDNEGGGDLDDALSNLLKITVAGFGAEFGFGAQGDSDFTQGSDLGQSSHVGWRKFTLPYDFSWVPGTVLTDQASQSMEAAIPLAVLYPAGVPVSGTTAAVFVRIIDHFGNDTGISNQTLPGCASDEFNEVCNVATLLLLP